MRLATSDQPEVKRHLQDTILMPAKFDFDVESLMFPVPWRPYMGKIIVIMIPDDNKIGEEFEFQGRKVQLEAPPEVKGSTTARFQPDLGIVAAIRPWMDGDGNRLRGKNEDGTPKFDKFWDELKVGDVVGVRPYAGAWFTRKDLGFGWIPEGRMVKFLGKYDVQDDLLFKLEDFK